MRVFPRILFCRFGRSISGTDLLQDIDLNGEYYVLYGRSVLPFAGELSTHTGNELPAVSANLVNVLTSTGVQAADSFQSVRNGLVRAHGILMLIAWPLLATTAIFFATNMRGALPKGEWFQVHRAFMIASLILTALGFVLIFISQARNPIPGLSELGISDHITVFCLAVCGRYLRAVERIKP